MTRREFLVAAGATLLPMRLTGDPKPRPARLAVITDLHHGLAPDALSRLEAFVKAIPGKGHFDAVLQMGDFTYCDDKSKECLDAWAKIGLPKMHVLGNHDMDKVDKATALKTWGAGRRYYARMIGGYRFVVLDLNHFKKDGVLHDYEKGNYFTDNATFNIADPEQLAWLRKELMASRQPVILISHQPLGFADDDGKYPAEQTEVLDVVTECAARNPAGAVALCMFGHLHVDRLETYQGIPCYCVNSASYFWSAGMHPYSNPLFSFMEFGSDGVLRVEGASGEFVHTPPAASDKVKGRSASIENRQISLL